MNLVHDYIHPVPGSPRGRCRIRLYLAGEPEDSPVMICTDEPASERLGEGTGRMYITNCAKIRAVHEPPAAKVIEANRLERPPIWLEHYEDGARGSEEDPHTFDLVTFSSYEAMEFVSAVGWDRQIGRPSWQVLDRQTVEALIGEEL